MTNEHAELRRLKIIGGLAVLLFGGGFMLWGSFFELSGAVIADGRFIAESNIKKVQHPNGGAIAVMAVKEGDKVEQNQLLARLDDTDVKAELSIIENQIDQLDARVARLIAERDQKAELAFPDALVSRSKSDAKLAGWLDDESQLFRARRASMASQKRQLSERAGQLSSEIDGLKAQEVAVEQQVALLDTEQTGASSLLEKGFIEVTRVNSLRRQVANLKGEHGRLVSEMARAEGQKIELQFKLDQLDDDMRSEAGAALRDTQDKLRELGDKRIAAQDRLNRIDIRAPQAGYVHQLQFHVAGEVVEAGAILMMIVPDMDQLVVDASVAPKDIDQIHVGARANVRVMAGDYRSTSELDGKVTRVGADLITNQQTGVSYYSVRVTLDQGQAAQLGDLQLVSGMPVECFVQTGSRTPLQYLTKPLIDQIWRTWRER
ncbi:HlyD family type I secretion periplasmic adaptor subunit [Kaistia dalseonensis]|uniref:Membrane fusion protein (MFP) family protein n=1 Tax=Kaistia dalseonensis TaxID=410840 RepID=A0ABU0H1Z5_9HYPH|nr:HlyD family type I secretion periplasmic adaptor subunit [Kaistia dalseonensis]MCX5493763.1 HlyD family type I secretion periplasmic adaptor subunit [Kaistia dalseonensis]MDQ0436327.1 HlyD family secretion protein [Kaistia dalseonensis]